MASLEKTGQDACAAALKKYGFKARRRGLLLQPGASKEVSGWLGLNLATWDLPRQLLINPVVGVRHVPVEKALVELADWEAPVACVTRPLGYLMPQHTFVQWEFPADADLTVPAEDLAKTLATYGQPFIDHWSDWAVLSSELADSGLLLNVQEWLVLPIIAALNGDRRKAEEMVRAELARVGDAPDVYSAGYRDFAAKFSDYEF